MYQFPVVLSYSFLSFNCAEPLPVLYFLIQKLISFYIFRLDMLYWARCSCHEVFCCENLLPAAWTNKLSLDSSSSKSTDGASNSTTWNQTTKLSMECYWITEVYFHLTSEVLAVSCMGWADSDKCSKIPEKWLKPWHMGTHLKVLSEG